MQQRIKLWQVFVIVLIVALAAVWITLQWVSQQQIPTNLQSSQEIVSATTSAPAAKQSNEEPAKPKVAESDAVLNSSGYITARRMATVSAELTGRITQVNVEEGMAVEQGQVLATLDDALAKVNLQLAQAQVEVLKARRSATIASLEEARRNYKRAMNNEFSSDAERTGTLAAMQGLEANLSSNDADIRVAVLQVQRQQERLDDYTIRAPFGGIVTVKNAQPGEIVSPASAGGGFTRTGICTIVDMRSLEIEVDVNESFIGRVYPGQPVEAKLDAYPDWKIPASVIAIIPTADRAKATVQVRIKLETSDKRILPDMGVKVAFLKARS